MVQQESRQREEGQKEEVEPRVPPRYVDPRLQRKFPAKRTDQPSAESSRRLQWWKTLPFGTMPEISPLILLECPECVDGKAFPQQLLGSAVSQVSEESFGIQRPQGVHQRQGEKDVPDSEGICNQDPHAAWRGRIRATTSSTEESMRSRCPSPRGCHRRSEVRCVAGATTIVGVPTAAAT